MLNLKNIQMMLLPAHYDLILLNYALKNVINNSVINNIMRVNYCS